jgi:hypothetical protein
MPADHLRPTVDPASLSEAGFQAQVESVARTLGWKVFHAPDNIPRTTQGGRQIRQRIQPGFPDIVAVKGERMVALELKRKGGWLRPEQREWLEALNQVPGVEARVCFPKDWDAIVAMLAP